MLGESLAIIVVILVLAFMAIRSGKLVLAGLTVPLISLSMLHLIGEGVAQLLRVSPDNRLTLFLGAHTVGLLLGLCLCALASRTIAVRRIRSFYLLFTCLFLLGLFTAYRLQF